MRGAVTHGEYVVVAGHVGATGNVIGVLGEAGGHSIGPLQDTHCWLCSGPGQKEGNIGRGTLGKRRLERSRHSDKKRRKDSACN